MSSIEIAAVTKNEVAALAQIEKECFADPWSEDSLLYETENPSAHFICAKDGEAVMGYMGMHHVLDEGYVANVAVSAKYRRRGIASALITAMLEEAKGLGLAFVSLEVRVSNRAAIALYSKFGFENQGIRKGYYDHPKEDAMIMTLYFGK